jgi:hypothetical protein
MPPDNFIHLDGEAAAGIQPTSLDVQSTRWVSTPSGG